MLPKGIREVFPLLQSVLLAIVQFVFVFLLSCMFVFIPSFVVFSIKQRVQLFNEENASILYEAARLVTP